VGEHVYEMTSDVHISNRTLTQGGAVTSLNTTLEQSNSTSNSSLANTTLPEEEPATELSISVQGTSDFISVGKGEQYLVYKESGSRLLGVVPICNTNFYLDSGEFACLPC
jgi:hypothetical protein